MLQWGNLHVDSAELDDSPSYQFLNILDLRDICLDEYCLTTVLSDELIGGNGFFCLNVGGTGMWLEVCADEMCTFGGVGQGYGAAETGRGACHYADFVFEAVHDGIRGF